MISIKIVSLEKKVGLTTKCVEGEFIQHHNPGTRFLLTDAVANKLQDILKQDVNVSDFQSFYCQHVHRPVSWRGKKVLFYFGQGMGDQLMGSCLSHYFTKQLGARCYQLADRMHDALWMANEHVQGSALEWPIHLDSLVRFNGKPFFDYAFFIEDLYHWMDCSEQLPAQDVMFSLVGVDPKNVSNRYKIPVFNITADDTSARLEWQSNITKYLGVDFSNGYILFQLRASNSCRSLPLHSNKLILDRLSNIGLPILVVDDDVPSSEIVNTLKEIPRVYNCIKTIGNIRAYGAIVIGARLAVGPDSCVTHFCASAGTPCLSFWGPFSQDLRIRYYPNQIGLYYKDKCPNSPCTNYLPEMPISRCPLGEDQIKIGCACFQDLSITDIDLAIEKLLNL